MCHNSQPCKIHVSKNLKGIEEILYL